MTRAAYLAIAGSVLLSGNPLFAAKAPLSINDLSDEADAIVVGEVVGTEVKKERARIERGFGNYDWAVYSTVRVHEAEKGDLAPGYDLIVRSFRIKSRTWSFGHLTASGNHPIPGNGAQVRVYLLKKSDYWHAIHPNGYQPANDEPLRDADEVLALRSRLFTYLLPMELWSCLVVFGVIAITLIRLVNHLQRRRTAARNDTK